MARSSCSTRSSTSPSSTSRACGHPLRFARPTRRVAPSGRRSAIPGGGRLEILPAAVAGSYPATGHDIYGKTTVRAQILELRAAIDRGDSGGPLILQDGTVGGVVFAEARTDPDVGYALSPDRGRDPHRAGDRPDRRGRHRRLLALIARCRTLRAVLHWRFPVRTEPRTTRCPTRAIPTTARPTPPSATPRP